MNADARYVEGEEKSGWVITVTVAEGDRTQFGDAGFRRELAAWLGRRAAQDSGTAA